MLRLTKLSTIAKSETLRSVRKACSAGHLGLPLSALVLSIGMMATGCRNHSTPAAAAKDEYHADNDIAMIVRSVSDAFAVDEPLLKADYQFDGVLTDGAGMPLYTDIMGSPGQWKVEVVSNTEVRIRNLYLGDLLPENLQQYLVQALELEVPEHQGSVADSEGNELEVAEYNLPGGTLHIETSEATAPNGASGPLMNISIRKSPPISRGSQST